MFADMKTSCIYSFSAFNTHCHCLESSLAQSTTISRHRDYLTDIHCNIRVLFLLTLQTMFANSKVPILQCDFNNLNSL